MSKKIEWIQIGATTTGKVKADATVQDESGVKTDVTIWGDFPNFATLMAGMTVEGDIVQSKDGKYKPSLNAPRLPKFAVTGGFKTKAIEDAQIRKEGSINRTLDRKEESIALMSAQRDATLIVVSFYKEAWGKDPILESELDKIIKKKIIEWRDWYLSKEFTDHLPF